MPILRKVVTSGIAVVAGLLLVSGTGSAAPAAAADDRLGAACNVKNHPTKKINKEVWRDATAYDITGDGKKYKKGTLTAGTRYFYCQKDWGQGYRESVQDPKTKKWYTNTWWALTDVPGAANVWVNVVNLTGGNNNQPEPGLPQGT